MIQQRPSEQSRAAYLSSDIGVWFCRVLGAIVLAVTLAVGAKIATDASANEGWAFLFTIMTPMGIGFLILVAAELLNRLGERR